MNEIFEIYEDNAMYKIIFNPGSRGHRGISVWNTIKKILDEKDIEYLLYKTNHAGHAEELVHQITSDHKPHTFIVVGGDGTINEVLNGIVNPTLATVGLIPAGSGNDFARALKLPSNPTQALQQILNCTETKQLHYGETHLSNSYRRFLISCGYGFDSDVCCDVQTSRLKHLLNKIRIGKLTYTLIALKKLIKKSEFSATIKLDDDYILSMDNIFFVVAMNTKFEGGGYMFCPDADPASDKLNFLTANNLSRFKLLYLIPKAKYGKHLGHSGVDITLVKKISLRFSKAVNLHTDGEVYGKCDYVTINCSKDHINFLI